MLALLSEEVAIIFSGNYKGTSIFSCDGIKTLNIRNQLEKIFKSLHSEKNCDDAAENANNGIAV